MKRSGWIVAVLALLLLVAGVWTIRPADDASTPPGEVAAPDPVSEAPTKPRPARKPAAELAPAADVSSSVDGIPAPVNLDAVDRDRDLHGVVVRKDGTPVAGAQIVSLTYPWRQMDVINYGVYETTLDGPRTRSAVDGTFAIRLRRGTRAGLRVTAGDYLSVTVTPRLAGERVRVVLDAGVRLHLTVVDDENHLLPGVKLRIWCQGWTSGRSLSRETVTGEDGEALLDELPGGENVIASLLSHGPGYPGWINIKLADSGETAFRVVLPKGRTLTGRVVDDVTGAAIAKARVDMNRLLDLAVETDGYGRFELPGWTGNGGLEIDVCADGYVRESAIVGERSEFDFRLRKAVEATGRIVDGSGHPVGGALVGLHAFVRVDHVPHESDGDATCGADGRFRVAGLDAKLPHVLVVVADGFGRLRRAAEFNAAAASVDLGDVVLPPARLLAGRFLDVDGKPVPRAHVQIDGSGGLDDGELAGNRYGRSEDCRTDDLGRFAFADLAAGVYEIEAHPDGQPVTVSVQVPPDRDLLDVTIRAAATAAVEVRVVDDHGEPVHGQFVVARLPGNEMIDARTDAKGVALLQIPGDSAQIDLPVFVETMPRFLECESQRWKAGTASITFVVHPGVPVEGVVLDPEGKTIPAAIVGLECGDGSPRSSETDASGRFHALVPAGTKGRAEFDGVDEQDPDLAGSVEFAAPATNVVLRCERIAHDRTLSVKVTTPDGAPQAGARVTAGDLKGWGREKTTTSDGTGVARFDELSKRPRRITVSANDTWAPAAATTVTPNGQQVTAVLRRAAEIRGRVVDAAGAGVRAEVSADSGDESASVTTGDDGRFVLRVPADVAGTWSVNAEDSATHSHEGSSEDVVPGGAEVRIVLSR